MTYGLYIEGVSNGVRINKYLENYKTLRGLKAARTRFLTLLRIEEFGEVAFSFDNINKYRKSSYKTLWKFNAKPFYEFWD